MGKLRIGYHPFLALLINPTCTQARCLIGNCYACADAISLQICEGQSITFPSEEGATALFTGFKAQPVRMGYTIHSLNVMFSHSYGCYDMVKPAYLGFRNASYINKRMFVTINKKGDKSAKNRESVFRDLRTPIIMY